MVSVSNGQVWDSVSVSGNEVSVSGDEVSVSGDEVSVSVLDFEAVTPSLRQTRSDDHGFLTYNSLPTGHNRDDYWGRGQMEIDSSLDPLHTITLTGGRTPGR